MSDNDLKNSIEALVFASDSPLNIDRIKEILEEDDTEKVTSAIENLFTEYEEAGKGIRIKKLAGGYKFVTNPDYVEVVSRLAAARRKNRLSRAGLETMSIVAYHEPVTKVDIEKMRGVDSSGPVRTLLDRKLIMIAGREKVPGRPLLYKTTDDFLIYFGINSKSELPNLKEIEEILQKERKTEDVTTEQLFSESGDSSEAEEHGADRTGASDSQ